MPIIKSAKKKLKQDKKRAKHNLKYEKAVEKVLLTLKKSKDKKKNKDLLSRVYSVIDKAVKIKIMHKNKASRLKSRLSRYA